MSESEQDGPQPGEFWSAAGDVLEEGGQDELAEMAYELSETIEDAVESDPAYADGEIDLDAPLGDGSEVIDPEVEAGATWTLETPHFYNTERNQPSAQLHIEDIADGSVSLHTCVEEDELELATLLQLDAGAARQLGRILIRSAAYAEAYGGDSDGDA